MQPVNDISLHRDDRYKQLKIMQDADQIVSECGDLIAQHTLDAGKARDVVIKAMLGEQPLALNRGSGPVG
jgi:heterodisulfide reductase subunit D